MTKANSLSLCMIVKDEEGYLDSCLTSAAPHVNEMIVVDTGSSDATIALAKKHQAQVFKFDWVNDFSAARNYSLAQASGDWILVLDADEQIKPDEWPQITQAIQNPSSDFYYLCKANYSYDTNLAGFKKNDLAFGDYQNYPGYTESWLPLLFQNKPEFRFKGYVHEVLQRDSQPIPTQNPLYVGIHNHGYALRADKMAAKKQLYIQIGLKRVQDNPQDYKANHDLGVTYLSAGDAEKALVYLKKAYECNPNELRNLLVLANLYHDRQNFEEALNYAEKAQQDFVNQPMVHAILGKIYSSLKRWDDAVKAFEAETKINPQFERVRAWLNQARTHVQNKT